MQGAARQGNSKKKKKRKHSMNGTNLVRGFGEREERSAARGVHRLELAVFRPPGIWRPRRSIGFGGGGGVEAEAQAKATGEGEAVLLKKRIN
jgi:hypothetical protein